MGWIEWCSFLLGGLVFWLLSWLLSWLVRRPVLRLQSQLTEAQTELASLRVMVRDFDVLNANFATVSKELDNAALKIRELEQQLGDLESLKTQMSSLEAERNRLKTDYDGLLLRFEQVESERSRLSTQVLNYQGELAVLSRQVEALRQDRDEQKTEAASLSSKLVNMSRLAAVLEGLRKRFGSKQPEELEAHFAALQTEVESNRAELSKLRAEHRAALEELQALQSHTHSLEASQDKIAALEAEIERYKNEFSGLQARYGHLEVDQQKLREAYENRIVSLEAEKNQLSSELQNLRARLDTQQKEQAELHRKLGVFESVRQRLGNLPTADLEARIVAIQNERNQYAAELDVLRKRVEAVAGERDHLRAEVEKLQNHLDHLSTESRNVVAERNRLLAEARKLQSDLQEAQGAYQDLEALRREFTELRSRLAKAEEERNWFSGEVQGLRRELEASRSSKAELERLRADHQKLQARIADYEAKLKQAQEDQTQMHHNYSALQARISEYETRLARVQPQAAALAPLHAPPAEDLAAAPARPAKPRKSRPKREVIGYRVTQSRTFRAEVVPEGHDPLGVIEGVGTAYQQKLWEAGIKTFADLARTPEARLREVIGRDLEFDEWIVEARRFVRGVYKLSRATARGSRRKADDLTRIEGIGPKMRDALVAAGITTFEDLEAATEGQLRAAIEAAGMSFAPSLATWSRQAAYLVRGDEAGFQAYIARLTAGREE